MGKRRKEHQSQYVYSEMVFEIGKEIGYIKDLLYIYERKLPSDRSNGFYASESIASRLYALTSSNFIWQTSRPTRTRMYT